MLNFDPKTNSKRLGAVILSGGRGTRMNGNDKGLVQMKGKTFIETALEHISPYTSNIVISANRNLEQYQNLDYPVIADDSPDFSGPLAGIARAMNIINTELLLIFAVDIPTLPTNTIPDLMALIDQQDTDICCVQDGKRLQPLISIARTELVTDLEHYLRAGHRKVTQWFCQQKLGILEFDSDTITNINTARELEQFSK